MAAWSDWTGWDEDNEDDDNVQDSATVVASKDCLILLIDASQAMFSKTEETQEMPFELCIKCAKCVLLNKIISSDKDLVGIVFFGTNSHKNASDFKNVYVLQDLDIPDAPRIKKLEGFLEDEDFSEFKKEYGSSDNEYSLNDVFWTCQVMFSTSGSKFSNRRILLFTNNDNPHSSNVALQRQAKTKAKDLAENGIEVELMHLGRQFDVTLFYRDIIFTSDEEALTLPDPSERFEELLTRVRSKEFKKRALQRISFSLGPGLDMGVGVYCLVRETKKPSFIRLDKRTNEGLKTRTKLLCEDTGNVLLPTDIKYHQEFGGEKVAFEKEEIEEMKKFGKPGLTLLGFKPKKKLKLQHYVKPANFIYPDESSVTGSTKLFSALLQKCIEKEVIAICKFIPRTNSAPFFIALLPQEEEIEDNIQITPPGFHVMFLPFTEDLRKLDLPKPRKATLEQIDKAKEIVQKLKFDFHSEAFENPVLQKHYRTLEALALEHEEVDEITDLTMPDEARIDKRVGPVVEAFKQLVYPDGYVPGAKRKAASSSGTSAAKRKPSSNTDPVDVETTAKNGTLGKLTVPVLKEYLTSVGKKPAGKKQDLINAINEHLGLS